MTILRAQGAIALAVAVLAGSACGGSDVPPVDPTEAPTQPPKREEELPQAPTAPPPAAPAAPTPAAAAEQKEHARDHVREQGNDRRDRIVEETSGWSRLGERWVEGAADRDVIQVGKGAGPFRSLLIGVEHSGLVLFDVAVTFGNGERFAPVTRLVFDEGAATRVIDLPGKARTIKQVEFRYGNLPGGGRAQIELWAK